MIESRLTLARHELNQQIKKLRRIHHLISKPEFEKTFADTGLKTQDDLIGLIRSDSERALREWLDRSRKIPIEEMSARQLEGLAQREGVSNYKRIGTEPLRTELIRLRDS